MRLETQLAKAASRALHDTAQPLTVLQGLLELALERAQTVEDYRESVIAALAETARVTACFENVRQFVRLLQPAPDVCEFLLGEAVRRAVDELCTVGARVHFDPENVDGIVVCASPGRVRRAVYFLASALAANGQNQIHITLLSQPRAACIRLTIAGNWMLDSPSLEMARLVAASAGCEIHEAFDSISLVLPKTAIASTKR